MLIAPIESRWVSGGGSGYVNGGGGTRAAATAGTLTGDYATAGDDTPQWSIGAQLQAQAQLTKGQSTVKWKGLGILALLGAGVLALGQSDSTVHVKAFPGATIGAKMTQAVLACSPDLNVPCILVIDASLATTAQGVFPSLPSNATIQDFRLGVPVPSVNVRAASYPGGDCGAKIAAADSAFSAQAVEIDVDQTCGTAAWTGFTLSSGHNLKFMQPGTYNVGVISLAGQNVVDMTGFDVVLQPATTSQAEIFNILGSSQSVTVSQISLNGGFLAANGNTGAGHSAIFIQYATRVHINGMVIDGGWDRDIWANNFYEVYVDWVRANGAQTDGIYAQNTGSGPYFGGPLYISHTQVESCPCSDAAIRVNDLGQLELSDFEVLGVTSGKGVWLYSSNGLIDNPQDFGAAYHLTGGVIDSIADEGLRFENIEKSSVTNVFVSGGRTHSVSGISLQGINHGIDFISDHVYWTGQNGVQIGGTATDIKFIGGSYSGSPSGGIHLAGTPTHVKVIGAHCDSIGNNGAGVTEPFCIYEEATGANNQFIDVDGAGTTSGNHYGGTNDLIIDPAGTIQAPGLPSGCAQLPCLVASVDGTYTGTTSQTNLLTYTPPSAGEYRFCESIVVTTAATAGTVYGVPYYTSDGHGMASGFFSISATTQWGLPSLACTVFHMDAAAMNAGFTMSGITGTPTLRYSMTLERVK